jgi:hypothetical protein
VRALPMFISRPTVRLEDALAQLEAALTR